jgi:hypothetical protein
MDLAQADFLFLNVKVELADISLDQNSLKME